MGHKLPEGPSSFPDQFLVITKKTVPLCALRLEPAKAEGGWGANEDSLTEPPKRAINMSGEPVAHWSAHSSAG